MTPELDRVHFPRLSKLNILKIKMDLYPRMFSRRLRMAVILEDERPKLDSFVPLDRYSFS